MIFLEELFVAYLVIRRRSKKLGEPRRRGIDGDLDELLLQGFKSNLGNMAVTNEKAIYVLLTSTRPLCYCYSNCPFANVATNAVHSAKSRDLAIVYPIDDRPVRCSIALAHYLVAAELVSSQWLCRYYDSYQDEYYVYSMYR